MPTGGRNFEYFSEDPYLTGLMGIAVTRAIQAHGIVAMAKHFVLNDTEVERFRTSVEVDEHVLRELYLLPFEMVVKDGGVLAVMSAYNRVRGTYATENRYLLTDVLRGEWNEKWFNELEGFPSAKHDDAVDSTSRAFSAVALDRRYNYLDALKRGL